MQRAWLIIMVFLCVGNAAVKAQTALTLAEAETALRQNNLLLLAEQYSISAAEANVIQARIWDLPQASVELNLLNPSEKKVFDVGQNGQKAFAIQQIIYIGGKKKAEVDFAKSSVPIARLQFEQLLRSLQFQLGQSFYTLYYDQLRLQKTDAQIQILDTLLHAYQTQADGGNIPLKELVRLEALTLNLRSNRTRLAQDILEAQRVLSLLTGISGNSGNMRPVVPENPLAGSLRLPLLTRDSAVAYALQNNLDYKTAQLIAQSSELRLRWQRTLAVPDPAVGLSYDQNGGAFRNQVNLTLGIPLPFWNRNKGNIREAEARLSQSRYDSDYRRTEIATLAATQYDIWLEENRQLSRINAKTIADLETVYQGTVLNFRKRNISLLEFTDFVESYNQATNQLNEIRKGWMLAALSLQNTLNLNLF